MARAAQTTISERPCAPALAGASPNAARMTAMYRARIDATPCLTTEAYRTVMGKVTSNTPAALDIVKRKSPAASGTSSKSYVSPFPDC